MSDIKIKTIKAIDKEIKIVNNEQKSYSKLIAEQEDYYTIFTTTTFGDIDNIKFSERLPLNVQQEILTKQCKSLNHLLKKLRKTKRLKHKVYYFATKELQGNGKLHLHASISIHKSDLIAFIEFIYDYKRRNHKNVAPIGRTHIAISLAFKNEIEKIFRLVAVTDKKDPNRIMYWIPYIESRSFISGEATFFEFVSVNDLKEKYNENITNYITKTILSQYDIKTLKIGVLKNYNEHNLKTLIKSAINPKFKKQVEKVRSICKKVYTTSRFPISFHLYQRNYVKLVKLNSKFREFYNVIKSFERGYLQIKNNKFFYMGKEVK